MAKGLDSVVELLEKLREFAHGAHLATQDENTGVVLHMICHKIDEAITDIKVGI